MSLQTVFEGRCWILGDNMNTDLMLPITHMWKSAEERARVVFSANRPGWADLVLVGDGLVAGANFGMGSSRPAALSLRTLGIGFVIAESINGLFWRTAMNTGLPVFECPGISGLIESELQHLRLSIETWTVENRDTGTSLPVTPVAQRPLGIMLGGGVFELLEKNGLIRSRAELQAS